MPRPRVYKTEAIVLRHQALGDADKIITIYTPHLGKLRIVAKGVLKPRSRLAGHVEALTRSSMMIARGQSLDVLSQIISIDAFVTLREDLARISQGIYAAELLDLFTAQDDADLNLYQAFLSTLTALSQAQDGGLVLRHFELRLLGILGFAPELYVCVSCGDLASGARTHFSASAGGLLCSGCVRGERAVRPISRDALTSLRFLQKADLSKITEKVTPPSLAREMEVTMRDYLRYQLEREVKSAAFLDRISRLPADVSAAGGPALHP